MKKLETVQIAFQKEDVNVLIAALETYSRLRAGQIQIAIETAFWDKDLSWEENPVWKEKSKPSSLKKKPQKNLKDATLAYEIKKTLEHYLHFQKNKGYCNPMHADASPPLKYSNTPLPSIVNFKPELSIKIPKRYQSKIEELTSKKDYKSVWKQIKTIFKKTPLPKGNWQKIEKVGGVWNVTINHPKLPQNCPQNCPKKTTKPSLKI